MPAGVWLFALIPIVLGGVFLLIGTIHRRIRRGWVPARGVVTTRDGALRGSGPPMSYPTFMWQDHHGAWHRRRAHVSSTRIPFGTPVAVLYDPQRPHRAMIDTDIFNGTFVFKVGLGIATIGTPLVLIALTLGALFA